MKIGLVYRQELINGGFVDGFEKRVRLGPKMADFGDSGFDVTLVEWGPMCDDE